MPDLGREISRALTEIRISQEEAVATDQTVQTFTWNGTEYLCSPGKMVKRNLFGAGGLTPDNDLRLDVQLVDLGEGRPSPGQMVTYSGSQWRIESVEYPAGGSVITLLCNDPLRATGIVEREM